MRWRDDVHSDGLRIGTASPPSRVLAAGLFRWNFAPAPRGWHARCREPRYYPSKPRTP